MRTLDRFVLMRSVWLAILLCLGLAIPANAVTLIAEDSYEGPNPEASLWAYTLSYCTSSPCPWLDVSTDVAHAGSQSLKLTYRAVDSPTGTNNAAIYRQFAATTDLYNRYWYRTSAFTYDPTDTKQIYWRGDNVGTGAPNGASVFMWGSRELGLTMQVIAEVCPPGTGGAGQGPYTSCNFYPNMASKPLADNVWYCIEEHVKMNDIGVANGTIEVWIDGTQTLGYYGQTFRGTDPNGPNGNSSAAAWTEQRIYRQSGDGVKYFDQFVAATTRVGCSGSPSADTTPPATPVGLFVR
jgi:hypothetical protein